VRDARAHGVAVRWANVNRSHWDCTLEPGDGPGHAVRLGLRMVRGLSNRDAAQVVAARGSQPYRSVEEVWKRAGVPVAALEKMARAIAVLPAAAGAAGRDRAIAASVANGNLHGP
jgi:error-prone DNA polymerase